MFLQIFKWNVEELNKFEMNFRALPPSCSKFVQTDGIEPLFEASKLKSQIEIGNKKIATQKKSIFDLRKQIKKFKSQIHRNDAEIRNLKTSLVDSNDLDVRFIVDFVCECVVNVRFCPCL